MKKIILALFCFSYQASFANAEAVDIHEQLFLTAKVWGFLKYYHPRVAKGTYQWDKELTVFLSHLKEGVSREEFSQQCLDWIHHLGDVPKCVACGDTTQRHFLNNFDLSWTQDPKLLSIELRQKLKYIEENRLLEGHHFVAPDYAGHFKMMNEPVYHGSQWVDPNVRLILLFRYWNAVEYYCPNKYLTNQNWDDVLREMIPKFLEVDSETQFHLAMRELVGKLDDSHAFLETPLLRKYFGEFSLPFYYKMINDQMIVTSVWNDSLARVNDLQTGDAILEIDGQPVRQIFDNYTRYINGSNEPTKLYYSFVVLPRSNERTAKIRFERQGVINENVVSRYKRTEVKVHTPEKSKWKLISNDVGYVSMTELEERDVNKLFRAMKDTRGIIFDLRDYPEFTMYDIANHLLYQPTNYIRFIKPDYSYPGKFVWKKPVTVGKRNGKPYRGKVVILVNEQTQSLAETTCMGLAVAPHAIVVGSQTSGANGDVSDFVFFEGITTWITGLGAFYPDGTQMQRKGVKIDVEVRPTLEGIRSGRDELLDKAIQLVHDSTRSN